MGQIGINAYVPEARTEGCRKIPDWQDNAFFQEIFKIKVQTAPPEVII